VFGAMDSVPKQLEHMRHLEIIKSKSISTEQKMKLVNTYNNDITAFIPPKTSLERHFLLDIIID